MSDSSAEMKEHSRIVDVGFATESTSMDHYLAMSFAQQMTKLCSARSDLLLAVF